MDLAARASKLLCNHSDILLKRVAPNKLATKSNNRPNMLTVPSYTSACSNMSGNAKTLFFQRLRYSEYAFWFFYYGSGKQKENEICNKRSPHLTASCYINSYTIFHNSQCLTFNYILLKRGIELVICMHI